MTDTTKLCRILDNHSIDYRIDGSTVQAANHWSRGSGPAMERGTDWQTVTLANVRSFLGY